MYSVQDAASLFKSQKRLLKGRKAGPAGATVGTTVLLLGLVSLLTDISAEMVTTVLPIYLITTSASRRCSTASSTACSGAPRRW